VPNVLSYTICCAIVNIEVNMFYGRFVKWESGEMPEQRPLL